LESYYAYMTANGWLFSAKLAWSNQVFRWASILAVASALAMSGFFLWHVFPAARQNGAFILHYNVYLGIDEVRSWMWVFLPPLVWLGLTLFDVVLALGIYRADAFFAWSLLVLAVAWAFPWSVALFFLTYINV